MQKLKFLRKALYVSFVIALFSFVCSCNRSEVTELAIDDDDVVLKMSSKALGQQQRIRLISIGSKDVADQGMVHRDQWYEPTAGIYQITLPTRIQDVYLLSNVPVEDSLTADQRYAWKYAFVDQMVWPYIKGITDEALIPQIDTVQHIDVKFSTKALNAKMEFAMAKVTINLNMNKASYPTDKYVVIDTLRIKHLPRYSTLMGAVYQYNVQNALGTEEYTNSEFVLMTPEATPDPGFDFTYNHTFYVPEYLFLDNSLSAILEVQGYMFGSNPKKRSTWETPLGKFELTDPSESDIEKSNSLKRGQHYIINGLVTGYGSQDIWIELNIKSWTVKQSDHELE